MSVSIYSKEEISRFTINKSTSKQMYSFSRAERFPNLRRRGCDTFYNLPSVQMRRGASIGIGTKSDFTKSKRGTNPEFYAVKRDFDEGNLKGPQFTFGICRDKYARVYYETNKMLDKNIPGPGKYNFLKTLGYDAPKFSMYEKLKGNQWGNTGNAKYPGPGAYPPTIKINDKGKYPTSNITNIKVSDFGASKSKRFYYHHNTNPAPNAYDLKSLMGENFNSKYSSSQNKSMGAKFKDYDSRTNYPGPGYYMAFSEFGIYKSKHSKNDADKKTENENENENENEKENENEEKKNEEQGNEEKEVQENSGHQENEENKANEERNNEEHKEDGDEQENQEEAKEGDDNKKEEKDEVNDEGTPERE